MLAKWSQPEYIEQLFETHKFYFRSLDPRQEGYISFFSFLEQWKVPLQCWQQ